MRKLDLNQAAGEFEAISDEHQVFYNKETGEFDFYIDPIYSGIENDSEKFESDVWIAAPSQRDIGEYDIMAEFAETVTDPRANELLCVALEGKGAFRRFKDTLHRVGLTDEWYEFKHKAYVELAKEWCEENGIEYTGYTEVQETLPPERIGSADFIIIPFHQRMTEDIIELMCSVLGYDKSSAVAETKGMFSSKRIALASIADNRVIGIIGAISQYGVTGWELHPLGVLKEYQRQGVGTALVEALEREIITRGGVMVYLGSDDETGTTSLYGVDLYEDTFEKIKNIQNIGSHPFPFYEKLGYKIVGVFPDANGIGKPDIWMAKRIKRKR